MRKTGAQGNPKSRREWRSHYPGRLTEARRFRKSDHAGQNGNSSEAEHNDLPPYNYYKPRPDCPSSSPVRRTTGVLRKESPPDPRHQMLFLPRPEDPNSRTEFLLRRRIRPSHRKRRFGPEPPLPGRQLHGKDQDAAPRQAGRSRNRRPQSLDRHGRPVAEGSAGSSRPESAHPRGPEILGLSARKGLHPTQSQK